MLKVSILLISDTVPFRIEFCIEIFDKSNFVLVDLSIVRFTNLVGICCSNLVLKLNFNKDNFLTN